MRVIGIDAAVLNDGGGGDDAALQRRHGGTHLEGGAGGVHALRGAVEHGQPLVRHQRLVVLVEGGQVIGGVAGQCQHLAAAHRYHGGSAAALVAVLVDHAGDGVGQRLLHIGLQVDVQRQRHRPAGLGLPGVQLAGELAVFVGGDEAFAVSAPQVRLKGLLHTGLTHQIVHGVALVRVTHIAGLFIAAPLLLPDGADGAEDMGGQRGVIDAGGGGVDADALVPPVGDEAQHLRGHILGKGIAAAAVQLIPHARHQPGLRVRQTLVDVVQRPQLRQQLLPGSVLRQFIFLQKGAEALRTAADIAGKAAALSDGQRIVPRRVCLPAQPDQPQNGAVQRLLVGKAAAVEHQRIGQPVGYQHLAVPVGDDAAGGGHRFAGGVAGDGLGTVLTAVQHLRVIQHRQKQQQAYAEKTQQDQDPPLGGMWILYHGKLLIVSRSASAGRSCGRENVPAALPPTTAAAPCPAASAPGRWRRRAGTSAA